MSTRLIAGSPLQKNGTFTSDLYPDVCYINTVSSNGIINSKFYPSDYSIPLLLLQVTVVIIITNIVRFILKPLKQPTFVSHVIGGLLVGPSGLGRLETFSNVVFPQTSLNVMKIGTVIGAIYYVFIIGVKQDPKVMLNRGRKTLAIATLGAILPLALIISIFSMALFITDSVGGKRFQKYFYLGVLLSLSSFSNLIPVLTELKLLNSKLGRLAISVSMNHSMVQCLVLFIYGVMKNSSQPYALVGYIVSMLAIIIFAFFIVRPLLFMVIHRTPEGEPVDNIYIIAILLGVLVIESINNIVGGTTLTGAMFFGLAMPEGPPLGAALVKKSETIVQIFFLPLVYAAVGLKTDVSAIHNLKSWMNLQSLLIIGYMAKTVGIVLSCRYFKMPLRDALSLSLIMNFSELPHLMSLVKANEYKLLGDQSYTHLVLAILVMTAIAAPLVRFFNRHTKLYMAYGLRTIEHSKPNAELRIVTCISSKENAPPMIELLETSHATRESPLFVWNINLVELEGRAAPMLISHSFRRNNSSSSMAPHIRQINNAFQICEQRNGKWFSIQTFTSVSPCQTMYQDVCMLALDKKASLLIMPFYRRIDGSVDQTLRILNSNILDEAPCSVGILIDHELHCNSIMTNSSFYHICVIFIGGADDREALSYGLRMAGHWCVRLDVVRILSSYDGNMVDDRMRLLDDEFIAIFRIKCTGNERVGYRVELVNDCVDTINVIQRMKNLYNLMLVGRRHERNSTPVQGLSQWCENPELGVIGDFLVSTDFSQGMVSVLVLQQQINVGLTVLNGHQQHIPQVNSGFAMSFY